MRASIHFLPAANAEQGGREAAGFAPSQPGAWPGRGIAASLEQLILFLSPAGDADTPDAVESRGGGKPAIDTLLSCFGVAAIATTLIMLLPLWWCCIGVDITPGQRDLLRWLAAVIAFPAAGYAARPFLASAVRAAAAGQFNADALVSAAIVLALGLSLSETLNGAVEASYDSALMLLAVLLFGRLLEQATLQCAQEGSWKLAAGGDATVTRIVSDSELVEVPA
jgi:cation transport ATPase